MSFYSMAGFFAGAFYFHHYDGYLIIVYILQPAIYIIGCFIINPCHLLSNSICQAGDPAFETGNAEKPQIP